MKIIKPEMLKVGDTVGIVAQSLPLLPSHKESFEKGIEVLKNLGLRISLGKTIGQTRWWKAGEEKEIAEDINSMFADKSIKAIMAHSGGYSSISALEYLDFDLISKNPKPYMGFSDMSSIHLALFEKVGLVGFHMDDLLGKGRGLKEEEKLFREFLMSTNPPGIIKPLTKWETWKKGKARGHLLGGNLHIMMAQSGTSYFPSLDKWEGAILFFEEVGESLQDIARALYELKYMGILGKISGMIVGKISYVKPIRDKEVIEPTYKEMILDILKDFSFPILGEFDSGHFIINIPMPLGIKVEIDTEKCSLDFLEAPCK